ncbi:hypothetical protein O203_07115 [Ectopseudomonas chengduensis]|nr:hypothetical protein O203_07115 [Pseudomonas chengduensis]
MPRAVLILRLRRGQPDALIHLLFRHAQPLDMEGVSIGNTA